MSNYNEFGSLILEMTIGDYIQIGDDVFLQLHAVKGHRRVKLKFLANKNVKIMRRKQTLEGESNEKDR